MTTILSFWKPDASDLSCTNILTTFYNEDYDDRNGKHNKADSLRRN